MKRHLIALYAWLITQDWCLCHVGLSPLCARIDGYIYRSGYWGPDG